MTALGWDLPPGTRDDDPDAPWNRDELSCWDCGQLDTDCICVPNDEDLTDDENETDHDI